MSSLIVYLPASAPATAAEYDYVLTHDGQTMARHGRCSADLLPREGEVVAVLGTPVLSWHSVRLPKGALSARGARNTARLRAALDALLEDAVLDEPAQLHLALAPQPQADGHWLVAVCAKAPLQRHLQVLDQAGRSVARIVPELEPGAPQWQALEMEGIARLAVVTDNAVTAIPLDVAGSRWAALATPPQQDEPAVWAEPGCAALAEQVCQRSAELQQREQRWLRAARTSWDLAQFDLISSTQARQLKRLNQIWQTLAHAPQWRAVRWGAVALLLVQVAGLNAWAWHERDTLRALRLGLQQTLTQTFPGVRTVIDAPAQMERELELLRRASGGTQSGDLEAMLGTVASALPAGRTVTALDYSGSTLRLKGLRLSPDELRHLQDSLRAQPLSANTDGETLVLEAKR